MSCVRTVVPQVYRVPETLKEKAKKSDTKKPNEKRSSGRGMYNDVILIDDDESEEEEDVEGSNKEYDWLGMQLRLVTYDIRHFVYLHLFF